MVWRRILSRVPARIISYVIVTWCLRHVKYLASQIIVKLESFLEHRLKCNYEDRSQEQEGSRGGRLAAHLWLSDHHAPTPRRCARTPGADTERRKGAEHVAGA